MLVTITSNVHVMLRSYQRIEFITSCCLRKDTPPPPTPPLNCLIREEHGPDMKDQLEKSLSLSCTVVFVSRDFLFSRMLLPLR